MDPIASLRRLVEHLTRDRIYLRNYESVVQRQHEDGSVDLLPDDPVVRGTGLSRVPIRHGLPGVTVKVVVGARCLLGYEGGDPQKPYAHLWDPTAIEEISFDGGTASIARMGDAVAVSWPPAVMVLNGAVAGAVVGTFTGAITITTQSSGIIKSGAPRVKA